MRPGESDKLALKFEELRKKYFPENSDIYSHFNDEQVGLLKYYSRYMTKKEFERRRGTARLGISNKKVEKLIILSEGVDDWEYDGFEDTGVMGGGHCSLGHALRYKHYAYSPYLDTSIVFGIKCISDFFDVSESLLHDMKKVSEAIFREIVCVALVHVDRELADWYYKTYYKDIEAIKNPGFIELYVEKYGQEEFTLFISFLSNSLALPPTLVEHFYKVYNVVCADEIIFEKLARGNKGREKEIELLRKIFSYKSNFYYINLAKEAIKRADLLNEAMDYYRVAARFVNLSNKIVKELKEIPEIGTTDLLKFREIFRDWEPFKVYYKKEKDSKYRFANLDEIENGESGVFEANFCGMDKVAYGNFMLYLFCLSFRNNEEDKVYLQRNKEAFNRYTSIPNTIEAFKNTVKVADKAFEDLMKMDKIVEKYIKAFECYKKVKAEWHEKLRNFDSLDNTINYIIENYDKDELKAFKSTSIGYEIAFKIHSKAYDKSALSDKQKYALNMTFKFLKNWKKLQEGSLIESQMDGKIMTLVKNIDKVKDANKVIYIITRAISNAQISEAEGEYLENEYRSLMAKDRGRSKGEDSGQIDIDSETVSKFVSNRASVLPSVFDISESLGKGVLH